MGNQGSAWQPIFSETTVDGLGVRVQTTPWWFTVPAFAVNLVALGGWGGSLGRVQVRLPGKPWRSVSRWTDPPRAEVRAKDIAAEIKSVGAGNWLSAVSHARLLEDAAP
jgi:hypothetical protein